VILGLLMVCSKCEVLVIARTSLRRSNDVHVAEPRPGIGRALCGTCSGSSPSEAAASPLSSITDLPIRTSVLPGKPIAS